MTPLDQVSLPFPFARPLPRSCRQLRVGMDSSIRSQSDLFVFDDFLQSKPPDTLFPLPEI